AAYTGNATCAQQREVLPQRIRRGGGRHADRDVAAGRDRPVERAAPVIDLAPVVRLPLGARAHRPFRLGPFEQIAMMLGMAPCEGFELAALGELLLGIGARGLEQ